MQFDRSCGTISASSAFDDVGIQSALGEEFSVAVRLGFFPENINKRMANNAPFLLGIDYRIHRFEESVSGVRYVKIGLEMLIESICDQFHFALSQETIDNQDTNKLLTYGPD